MSGSESKVITKEMMYEGKIVIDCVHSFICLADQPIVYEFMIVNE